MSTATSSPSGGSHSGHIASSNMPTSSSGMSTETISPSGGSHSGHIASSTMPTSSPGMSTETISPSTSQSSASGVSTVMPTILCPSHQYFNPDGTCWDCPDGQVVNSSHTGCEEETILGLTEFQWIVGFGISGTIITLCSVIITIRCCCSGTGPAWSMAEGPLE
eukprot:4118544-Amphidinium_carterae.1